MQIVDAHHHLWDLDAVDYPWLMARGERRFFGDPTAIQKNYLPEDLRADAQGFELLGSVHIQVGAAPGQELVETHWVEATAERSGLPSALVVYGELQREDIEAQLDAHAAASRLRGVRQIIGRSAEEDAGTGTGALLDDACWADGLKALARRDLSFDLQLIPPQTDRAAAVLATVPGLRVALCHCGSPWDRSQRGLAAWRAGLRKLAANSGVNCKISGLGMFDHEWTVDSIRPIVLTCIEIFGIERCMFGSNFPVDKLRASYDKIWNAYAEITTSLSAGECSSLFVENAKSFYRI